MKTGRRADAKGRRRQARRPGARLHAAAAASAACQVRRHAAGLVAGQPVGRGSPVSAKPLINVSPMRSQLAAVSAIKILLVGVERLILAPQLPQEIASFLTKTVTIFSVCCPHFWQRIRSIVQSDVENFMKRAQGEVPDLASPSVIKKIELLGNLDRATSLNRCRWLPYWLQHRCSRRG